MSVVMKEDATRGVPEKTAHAARPKGWVSAMFNDVDVMVDLQTGAISVVLPPNEQGDRIEIESVTADDMFAPRE